MLKVNGEIIIERIIRLLKENGVKDIAISTNNPAFDYIDVEKLRHKNNYIHNDEERHNKSEKSWLNAYYPMKEPACYLPGDVYYSDEAIKIIVETPVIDTMFFCVRDVSDGRPAGINIKGREPLAYKVQNQKIFRFAINKLFDMIDAGLFTNDPISWNLYRQINGISLDFNGYGNNIFNTKGNYITIDDYTTDIDKLEDIIKLEKLLKILKGGIKMLRVEVLEDFNLGKFNELTNIERKAQEEQGRLFIGDKFSCTEEMAEYLMGKNALGRSFVKVIEVIPEAKIEEPKKEVQEEKPVVKKKTTRKRKTIAKED